MADDKILPMNVMDYAKRIKDEVNTLKSSQGALMIENGVSFTILDEYALKFELAASTITTAINNADVDDSKLLRYDIPILGVS